MIIYGIIASTSISKLFTAGFVPGFLLGFFMMVMAYVLARRAGFRGTIATDGELKFWPQLRKSFFSLMAPVIILGGIYAGICTPVEASVIAIFYSLFVGLFITRELKLAEIWDAIKMTNASAGSIIIVLGVSTLFGRILTMQRIPHLLANWMITLTDNPYVILILIGLLLLFLGMFMETLATIVILAPIFLPLVLRVGIDPVFFRHLLGRHQRSRAAFAASRGKPVHCTKIVGNHVRACGQRRVPVHAAHHCLHHSAHHLPRHSAHPSPSAGNVIHASPRVCGPCRRGLPVAFRRTAAGTFVLKKLNHHV